MQETAVVFKVKVPVTEPGGALKCMNRINWISTFPTISRGDILLNLSESNGVYFWDGVKVIGFYNEIDNRDSVPPEFQVLTEFSPYNWEQYCDGYLFTDFTKLNITGTTKVKVQFRQVTLNVWVYTVKYSGEYYEIVSETELAGNPDLSEYLNEHEHIGLTILEKMDNLANHVIGYPFSKKCLRVFDFDNIIEIPI